MAEIPRISASIVDLIQLSAQITSSIHAYVGGLQRAPNDINQLVDELCSLHKTLMVLQHGYTTSSCSIQPKFQQLNAIRAAHGCRHVLQQLASRLNPVTNRKFMGAMGYSKWPLKEKEIRDHVSTLGKQRGLWVSIITSSQISHHSEDVESRVPSNLTLHDLRAESPVLNSLNKGKSTLDGEEDEFICVTFWRGKNSANIQILEGRRKQVFSWLRCGDYKRHLDIRQQRLKETGNWLLQDLEFQEWKAQRGFRLIWGCGIPGAGKTFISSMVIDHLESQASNGNFGVAHIYFTYQDQEQQDPIYALASLVEQLAHQLPNLSMDIEGPCTDLKPKGEKRSINELYSILLRITKFFRRVFFVFDALDECNQGQRRHLLPLFRRMEQDGISIFLTSRPYPEDIQSSLRVAVKIEISAKGEDIGMYIEQKIDEDPRAKLLVRQGSFRDKIITELVQSARGMFLLARFYIDFICRQTSTAQILIALEKIRSENSSAVERPLDPTYDRAMQKIRNQRKSYVSLATKVFSWLVLARRPLTLDELRTAVSIKPNQYRLRDFDLPDKATLLEVCDSLVTIGEHSNTVRLVHYTVQEYLLRDSIIANSDYKLAMACTTYLSFDIFSLGTPTIQDRQKSCPFLDYAARYLSPHLKACDNNTSTDSSIMLALAILKFIVSSGNVSTYLQALYAGVESQKHYRDRTPFWDSDRNEYLRLHIASAIGNHAVVRLLLEGANFSITGNDGWRVFCLAKAIEGHEAVANLLLNNKASSDIFAKDDYGQTALHVAASEGNTMVVQLLLEKGFDLSASDKYGKTALHMAAFGGHDAVVTALIYKGADVSALDADGKAALCSAVSGGHEEVIRVLIQNGADISTVDCEGWTLLPPATYQGLEAVVQTLLGTYNSVCYGNTGLYETPEEYKALALLPLVDNVEPSPLGSDRWALQRWRDSESTSLDYTVPGSSTPSGTPRAWTQNSRTSTYYTSDYEDSEEYEDVLTMDGDSIGDDSSCFNSCSGFGSSYGIVSHVSGYTRKRKEIDLQAGSQQQNLFASGPQDSGQGDGSDPPDRRRKKRSGRQAPHTPSSIGIESPPKYACPYYKNNAQQHPGCATWKSVDLHRVKEHCRRTHLKPLQCPRCGVFRAGDNGQMNTHLRDGDCVKPKEYTPIGCDDAGKGKALKKRGLTWKEIYNILFPSCPENDIPCPYWEDHVKALTTTVIGDGGSPLRARVEATPDQSMNSNLEFMLWLQKNMFPRFYDMWLKETGRVQLQKISDGEAIDDGERSDRTVYHSLLKPSETRPFINVNQPSQEPAPPQSYDQPPSTVASSSFQYRVGPLVEPDPDMNEDCVPGYDYGFWSENSQNNHLAPPGGYSDYFPPST